MKVNVTKECVLVTESVVINESEFNVNLCEFELPECFQGLTVTAAFNNIPVPLTGTQCYVPNLKSGTAILGVYAYKEEDGELSLMYSPKPACFYVNKGSYSEKTAVEEIPTVSEFERYCATVNALTFPKSDVVSTVDLENDLNDTKVYSVGALNSALAEVGEFLGNCEQKINLIREITEKKADKVTSIDEFSTDMQYPSAAAVYKALCSQSEKTGQTKAELMSEISILSKRGEKDKTELEKAINDVNDRVTQTQKNLDSVTSEQGALNDCIIDLQDNAAQLQERSDTLSEEIQSNKGDILQLNGFARDIQMDIMGVQESVDDLHNVVNTRVTDNANSIKGKKEGVGLIRIDDVSPLFHFFDVSVTGEGAEDTVVQCGGKNMLDFNGRTLSDFKAGDHLFTGKNIFASISGNGYYYPVENAYTFDESTGKLTVKCAVGWYGLGLDFKVLPNTRYALSVKSITDGFVSLVSFYDSAGSYISFESAVENKVFTTPSDAAWMIVIFTGKTKGSEGEFLCPQLESGDKHSEYQPYVIPQYATPDSQGKINNLKSVYPFTVLTADNPSVNIRCVYNKDTDKAYKALVEAITALGGSV
ncbi:MAG: hypothetical protein J6Q83_00740 [Clostridia bacterium]|nr:hypothetical protein [Clostridia bacterium]